MSSLADVYRASILGHSNGTVATSATPAVAPRQGLTLEQQQLVADIAVETGLRDAVKRQIERARPGFSGASIEQQNFEQELSRNDGDSVQLGLAKACARLSLRQLGAERAAPLI